MATIREMISAKLGTRTKTDVVSAINENSSHKDDYMPHESGLNQYASSADESGVYKVVTFKRQDNTTYMVSTASNPDSNGHYQTFVWQFYNASGTTIMLTKTWTIAYDANGIPTSKVVS